MLPLIRILFVLALTSSLAAFPGQVHALPADQRQILEDFFVLADGENWLRNDGWMDPEVHPCDWFGIECQLRGTPGPEVIGTLRLPGNHLGGTLDTRIFDIVSSAIDLSGNRLAGALDRIPRAPSMVDLSNNHFSGPLPVPDDDPPPGANVNSLWYLDLSNNGFDGEVPPDWRGTIWLSLAGNRLEGMPADLLSAELHPLSGRFLDLSDNQFSGVLPTDLNETAFMPHNGPSRWGGGLNLCWNDFEIAEPELLERLGTRHVGGSNFQQCLGRERAPMDITLSGSWFDAQRSGEGVVFHQLADQRALLYWFTFDDEGNQRWLVGTGQQHEFGADWRDLLQTHGRFGLGFTEQAERPPLETRGGFRLDHLGEDLLMAERSYIDTTDNICLSIYPPPLACFGDGQSDRLTYTRLTELAGTTCDNGSPAAGMSGAWFNPEREGEGFLVEVLPNGNAAIYWFTHRPDESGAQAWMIGVGQELWVPQMPGSPSPSGVTFQVDQLFQPQGASFGAEFDETDIELLEWGSLRIGYDGQDAGYVEWNSHFEDYGQGYYEIQRLSRPLLAECGQQD